MVIGVLFAEVLFFVMELDFTIESGMSGYRDSLNDILLSLPLNHSSLMYIFESIIESKVAT